MILPKQLFFSSVATVCTFAVSGPFVGGVSSRVPRDARDRTRPTVATCVRDDTRRGTAVH